MSQKWNPELEKLNRKAESALGEVFKEYDRMAYINTEKVMEAFALFRVSDTMFAGSTGYGYGDTGREALDGIYARVFGAEKAIVRHSIVNGTQALTIGLFALLRPKDCLLSITGRPYDTLREVIGEDVSDGNGSLRDFGVDYREIPLTGEGKIDLSSVRETLLRERDRIRVVFLQRSRGYLNRPSLSVAEIGEAVRVIRECSSAYIMVDNCYGEFTEAEEPTSVGADLAVGSLIKNPGGGMAESGGYLAGSARAVELVGYRLTSPGTGAEVGATLGSTRSLMKGLFFAPHVVAQALKTATFAAYIFEALGYEVSPRWNDVRSDIIQTVRCGTPEKLCAFCRGIQAGSPVDAFVVPEPWDMPGYSDPVIMAAGTFVQGASIELSADGPLRPPFTAFFQGGLTFESGRYGVLRAASEMLDLSKPTV